MTDLTTSRLMNDFATRTGLTGGAGAPKRYLWTDAFAVCNYLGLFVEHRDANALLRARALVDQTHRVLGKHRTDDPRTGWLSGLDEEEGARHPTVAGLRIGKALPERGPADAFDPQLEWERDGQYFHYLTKWMHALDRMTGVTGEPVYRRWAIELAHAAYAGFAAPPTADGSRGLYWKMSIDLSRPLVPSMGHHDPLDGLLTLSQLQSEIGDHEGEDLSAEIDDLSVLCTGRHWETDDPLGLGGLMVDAWRLAHLLAERSYHEPKLLSELLVASVRGLDAFRRQPSRGAPAHARLAFREFGLSIGLHAASRLHTRLPRLLEGVSGGEEFSELVETLARFEWIATEIEQFWQSPENRKSRTWQDHRDINEVMFATSLAPGGFLGGDA